MLKAAAATPFRIKKILVPIDFSDCSKKALQYAIPLARQHDAEITLLYAISVPSYSSGEYGAVDFATVESEMRTTGERNLAALVKEIGEDVTTRAVVLNGAPTAEIVEFARELPADIIIVSTHGRTGLKHVFLGSVAEHVVRQAPCPVLIVREREHEFLAR